MSDTTIEEVEVCETCHLTPCVCVCGGCGHVDCKCAPDAPEAPRGLVGKLSLYVFRKMELDIALASVKRVSSSIAELEKMAKAIEAQMASAIVSLNEATLHAQAALVVAYKAEIEALKELSYDPTGAQRELDGAYLDLRDLIIDEGAQVRGRSANRFDLVVSKETASSISVALAAIGANSHFPQGKGCPVQLTVAAVKSDIDGLLLAAEGHVVSVYRPFKSGGQKG